MEVILDRTEETSISIDGDFEKNSYSKNLKLSELSMGMSDDYEKAISNGSTYLRLGTIIFGPRNN